MTGVQFIHFNIIRSCTKNKFTKPLTIPFNRDWFFTLQFIQPTRNIYVREEKKTERIKRAPMRCQTQLIRNCWSLSAVCTMYWTYKVRCRVFCVYMYIYSTQLSIIYSLFVESTDLKYEYFTLKVYELSLPLHILWVRDTLYIAIAI